MLIGRGAERARIDELLDAARAGRGAALVVRGEPGIGKTALLDYAAERAERFRVLRALGVESESELPFAALHELLGPLLSELGSLPEAQANALRPAFAMTAGGRPEAFAAYAAALHLLTDAAGPEPVLCLIDDAHWIDTQSAQALAFAARRLHHDPVVMIFAARQPERSVFEAPGVPDLLLTGLHREAAEALLHQSGELERERRADILELAGGNPLALLELPAALSAQTAESGPAGSGSMPIGRRLERAFLGRVEQLSETARRAALLLAASDVGDLGVLTPALSDFGLSAATLEELEGGGLAAISQGAVTFTHPLVRSAVYQSAEAAARRAAHRSLAAAFRQAGDRERLAWHLAAAATGPDEEAAHALEVAAELARVRGGASAEARALERSARLTPDTTLRGRRLVAAARAARIAGRATDAEAYIDEALRGEHDEQTWAHAQAVLADIHYWYGRSDKVLALAESADRLARTDKAAAGAVLLTAAMDCGPVDLGRALDLADRALVLEPSNMVAASARATYLHRLGRSAEAEDAALEVGRAAAAVGDWYAAAEAAVELAALERYDEARLLATRAVGGLREQGAVKHLSHALCALTQIETRRGDLRAACEAGLGSLDLARAIAEPLSVAFAASFLAACEALMGREGDTREHAATAMTTITEDASRTTLEARTALGVLELQLGHPEKAVAHLEPVQQALDRIGVVDPGYVHATPDYVEALMRSGRIPEAERALDDLERRARVANRVWALAAAERCRLLAAPDAEIDDHFSRAMEWHDEAGRPIEQARTELVYGERLRRAGRRIDAREHLRGAMATFERAGSRLWAERSRKELAATGERLRRTRDAHEELSAQEFQDALVVARGATNKEAAAELFLSPKTIEFHLRNAYSKLGVRSRTELANTLGGRHLGE